MAKKHRVANLMLREISSVDRPAQVGAVSVLIKRREDPVVELIKASFAEALNGNMLAEKVQDVFYKAFEDWWSGKEAFRKALIDELATGGDGSVASTDFKAWLGTLVDQCLGAAKQAGAADAADIEKAFTQAAEDWLESQEQNMLIIKTKADLQTAIEKAQAAGDKVTVGDISAIHKAAATLQAEDVLPATGPLAKASAPTIDTDTAKKVERMEKRDALQTDLRKFYDGLTDDTARDAFLAKSADDQKTELTKAAGDDPVVYTTIGGIDIRKSAGDTVLALAKQGDEDKRELAKARAATEDVTLEKRAKDDLGNVGGELLGKKALLKAVDGITDTVTRDAAIAVLKAANESSKGIYVRKGEGGGAAPVVSDGEREMGEAEAKLEEMAKAHATTNKVTFEKAYAEVIQTAEGSELYKRYCAGDE
jgi:hypothetical protein